MDTDTTLHDLSPSAPPAHSGEEVNFEELSPAEVLAELQTPGVSVKRQRQLIFMSELLHFEKDQEAQLGPLLRKYIDRYASIDPPEEQVALSSAIRKYVSMLAISELSAAEEFLRPERKVAAALEMEVLKMITRKLTATLPEDTSGHEPLGEQLFDVAKSYLNTRILSKRFFGPAVLDASLSLALLRSPHLDEVAGLLQKVRSATLRAVIARQAKLLSADLDKRFPGDRGESARLALASLAAAAESVQS